MGFSKGLDPRFALGYLPTSCTARPLVDASRLCGLKALPVPAACLVAVRAWDAVWETPARGKRRRELRLTQVRACERGPWLKGCKQLCLKAPGSRIICSTTYHGGFFQPKHVAGQSFLGYGHRQSPHVLPCCGFPGNPAPAAPQNWFPCPTARPALPCCSLGLHFKQMLEEEREQRRVV